MGGILGKVHAKLEAYNRIERTCIKGTVDRCVIKHAKSKCDDILNPAIKFCKLEPETRAMWLRYFCKAT
jgi:hypothetical protein